MKKKKFYQLLAKKLSGQFSRDEENLFLSLLDKSKSNREQFKKAINFCKQVESLEPGELPDPQEEWHHLEARLRTRHTMRSRAEWHPVQRYRSRYRLAMIVPIAILSIAAFLWWKTDPTENGLTQQISKHGQMIDMTFTDGSNIRLNAGSKISYPEVFLSDVREVYLEGEAFFNIKENERPFIVITDNAKTTVLGTQFNVYSRNGKTRVVVKKGRVRLERIEEVTKSIELDEGKMSEIEGDNPPKSPMIVEIDQQLGWLERRLTFHQKPLKDIAEEIQRFYAIEITFANQDIGFSTLTGSFENMPVDTVMSAICLALEIQCEKKMNRYRLHY